MQREGWFSRLVLVSSLALTVSLGVIAATPSGFVWLRALESYGFIIETFEVDGSLRVLLRRRGTFVETAVGYHAAFVNYRELMVLQQPAYIDLAGNIFVPLNCLYRLTCH